MSYITVSDFKAYRDISGSGDDTLIGDLITAAGQSINTYTDREFKPTGDTSRTFDADRDVEGRTLYLDEDLASITSITNGDGTTVSSSQYTTEPRNETPYHAIRLLGSASVSWTYDNDPEDAITVTGKWGWSTSPPGDVVQATRILTAYYYSQRDRNEFDAQLVPGVSVTLPGGMPKAVREILKRYRKAV